MAQTGYTPISLYYSTTASAAPTAGNLANGELAINITDGKLYYKDNGGVVQTLANKNNTGTVTSVSWTGGIVSVANGTTTPAFTIAGTSGGIPYFSSASTWATSAALAANALVIGGGAGAAPATTTTGTGVLTALGVNVGSSGAFTTNNAANTFTALQTFSGSTSVAAAKLANAKEVCTVSATAATGTIAYDLTTQSVVYYTSNAAANWTVNFRGSSGTSLDTIMATGESMTAAFLVTQGATAYYNSAVQVDGVSVTPKWQGGTAPTSGNASSIDAYVYTIVKTGSATFTVFASQTKFA